MVSRRVSARSTLFSSSLADRPPVYTASRPCSSAPAAWVVLSEQRPRCALHNCPAH